jgi:Domain of unknown function (DUF4376)
MAKEVFYDALTGRVSIVEIEEVISLDELKKSRQDELMNIYKESIISGFTSSATGENIRYGYKEQDQLNYSKLANLFALNPTKTSTILGSDSHGVVTLSKEQFLQFMEDAEQYEMSMYVRRKELEEQINSTTTIDELQAITLSF